MMSSMCSMPTLRRMVSGPMPAMRCSCGDICRCVVEAGWQASDLASPEIHQALEEAQRIVEARAGIKAAANREGQQRAGAPAQILLRKWVVGIVGEARVAH